MIYRGLDLEGEEGVKAAILSSVSLSSSEEGVWHLCNGKEVVFEGVAPL